MRRSITTLLATDSLQLAELEIEDNTSEGEDILGEDTPSDETDEQPEHASVSYSINSRSASLPPPVESAPIISDHDKLFSSQIRARNTQASQAITTDTAQTTSSDTGTTTVMHEKMLSHNRTEQESLTDSLLSMAQALKQSSQAFQSSLDSEKDVLTRAAEGLEKNTSGIEAAQKRMGYLRKMSEGKGWWGRMMLYAWIFGLMFLAFFIVAFMPKLRF